MIIIRPFQGQDVGLIPTGRSKNFKIITWHFVIIDI